MGDVEVQDGAAGSYRTPPYVSYQTFLTLLGDLKTNGMPPRIDRSVLKRFSGGVSGQLLGALRSLSLMDSEDQPTPRLKRLVHAYESGDGAQFKTEMREVLQESYPWLSSIDLMTATPSMFAEEFKKVSGAKEDVLRKCRTFYLHAARHAEVPVGPRLEKGGGLPRAAAGNGRSRRKRMVKSDQPDRHQDDQSAPPPQQKALEYQLIDLMSEPDIEEDTKQAIWSLVQFLMARKARQKAEPSGED